nr:protein translocase subunit SecDF [Bacteroidota bacterium]
NKLLKLEIVKNEFPRKLKLCWSITTFRDFTADTTFELIALKRNYNDEPALDGRFIIDAKQTFNQGGSSEIAIEMNNQGAKTWRRLTSDNINKSIAIVCDDQVFSYPTVQGEIPNGRSSITGNFTVEEAKDIASIMKFGRLPLNVKIINKKTLNSH